MGCHLWPVNTPFLTVCVSGEFCSPCKTSILRVKLIKFFSVYSEGCRLGKFISHCPGVQLHCRLRNLSSTTIWTWSTCHLHLPNNILYICYLPDSQVYHLALSPYLPFPLSPIRSSCSISKPVAYLIPSCLPSSSPLPVCHSSSTLSPIWSSCLILKPVTYLIPSCPPSSPLAPVCPSYNLSSILSPIWSSCLISKPVTHLILSCQPSSSSPYLYLYLTPTNLPSTLSTIWSFCLISKPVPPVNPPRSPTWSSYLISKPVTLTYLIPPPLSPLPHTHHLPVITIIDPLVLYPCHLAIRLPTWFLA